MVKRLRLNEKSVREAVPEPGRDYQIFDSEVRGFAICIYRSGNRAFTLDYRHAGRQRRMTLGRWPEWSTAAARKRAKELRRDIDAGGDPLGAKEGGRDAPRFKDLVDRYAEVHLPNLAKTNASDQRSMLTKLVGPDWNNRLVTEITPYDVEKLLNRIAEGRSRPHKAKPNNRARKLQGSKPTPVRANRVGEVLRKMFTYAQSWGWREDNPASGFRRRIENPRERFLSQEEIRKLAAALDAAEDRRGADIIRLCMLTGARVGEVRQARFEHFNLEHLSWSKPASMTKQRKIHRLPISDEAAAIVRQRQLLVPRGCAFLFPGDVPGQPVKEIRRFWAQIGSDDVTAPRRHLMCQGGSATIHKGERSCRRLSRSGSIWRRMYSRCMELTAQDEPFCARRYGEGRCWSFSASCPLASWRWKPVAALTSGAEKLASWGMRCG